MSKNRSSFLKRDREAKKREKRELKKQRREDRKKGDQQAEETSDSGITPFPPEDMQNDATVECGLRALAAREHFES